MKTRLLLPLLVLVAIAGCSRSGQDAEPPAALSAQESDAEAARRVVSGRLEDGLRVLTFDPAQPGSHFTIYRGDYVRPELAGGAPFTIEIPDLDVTMSVPVPEGERPYFKVPMSGAFPFRIGELTGIIEAVEYTDKSYREVGAKEAAHLVADLDPLVLDVRTEREFADGHIEGAVLIPVQSLAKRLGELDHYKSRPIFVYCRTGNRSTVAAQMLVKAGFGPVINLRHGIVEWTREDLPVVK